MKRFFEFLLSVFVLLVLAGLLHLFYTSGQTPQPQYPEEKKPKAAVAYYKEGITFIERKEYEKAASSFKKALDFQPESKIIKQSLSTVYVKIGSDFMEKREYDRAREALSAAIECKADNADAYVFLGDVEYYSQRLSEAGEYWRKARSINPGSEIISERLSMLNEQQGVEEEFESDSVLSFTVAFEESLKIVESYGMRDILWNVYREVGQDFGYFPKSKIIILFYPQDEYMELTGYGETVRGHYDGKIRIPILESEEEIRDYKPAIWHEYTHAIVHALCASGVPVWLNEGLALYEENKKKTLELRLLKEVLKNGAGLIPLNRLKVFLTTFTSPYKTELAYDEAFTLVDYIIDRYGLWHIKNMLLELSKGEKDFDEVLRGEIYTSLEKLEKNWRKYIEKKYL